MAAVDDLVKDSMESLGVPAGRLKIEGSHETYIVWQRVFGKDISHADDGAGGSETSWMASLYSKNDYVGLRDSMVVKIKEAGFHAVEIMAETYEDDTEYYHASISFKYMEEVL